MLLSLLLIGTYAVFATLGNLDLRDGRYALFMDERITFDGVYKILHPSGLVDFVLSIAHGGDHRYGRSLWYTLAFFSFIPERLFGDIGLIVADRTVQLLLVIAAFVVLSITFLRHWFYRLLLLSALLTMPYTAYYTSMPKPEPLQLLFISIFLYYYRKYEMSFQGWYWIFLGLAFGTKISTLPVVLIILVASVYQAKSEKYELILTNLTSAIVFFLIGLAIAVPILMPHLFIGYVAFKAIKSITNKRLNFQNSPIVSFTVVTSLFIVNFLISGFLALKFKLKIPFAVWFNSTFLNTTHGSDSNSVNFLSWVYFTLEQWLIAPVPLSIVLSALGLYLVVKSVRSGMNVGLVAFAAGLLINISIFAATHRLWGFYLFSGFVLMLVGLFSIIESSIYTYKIAFDSKATMLVRALSFVFISLFILLVAAWWLPESFENHTRNANRTSSENYKKDLVSFNEIVSFLSDLAVDKSRSLNVAYDPAVFLPRSTKDYLITEFWGPYTSWEDNFDVIILGTGRSKGKDEPPNTPAYRDYAIELAGYRKYVFDDAGSCNVLPCYVKHRTLPNGAKILIAKHLLSK